MILDLGLSSLSHPLVGTGKYFGMKGTLLHSMVFTNPMSMDTNVSHGLNLGLTMKAIAELMSIAKKLSMFIY